MQAEQLCRQFSAENAITLSDGGSCCLTPFIPGSPALITLISPLKGMGQIPSALPGKRTRWHYQDLVNFSGRLEPANTRLVSCLFPFFPKEKKVAPFGASRFVASQIRTVIFLHLFSRLADLKADPYDLQMFWINVNSYFLITELLGNKIITNKLVTWGPQKWGLLSS